VKQTLFILFSFVGALNAAPINYDTKAQVLQAGIRGTITDSAPTYALNSVSSSVASSFIDLSATGAIVVCVTGTATTSSIVQVQYSNTNTAAANSFFNSPFQLSVGCWPIQSAARYVRFVSVGTSLTAKTSVNYYISSDASATIAGSVTITSGVLNALTAVAQSTTYANIFPVTATSNTEGSGKLTLTLTAQSCVSIDNPGTSTVYFMFTNTTYTPSTTASLRLSVAPSTAWCKCVKSGQKSILDRYLYYINADTVTKTVETTD
jgi:hypothetical protein